MPLRVQGRQKRGAIWYRMCPVSKPVGTTASRDAIASRAGNVQFLGEMPWEAGRLRSSPTRGYMIEEGARVNVRAAKWNLVHLALASQSNGQLCDALQICRRSRAWGRRRAKTKSVKRYCA